MVSSFPFPQLLFVIETGSFLIIPASQLFLYLRKGEEKKMIILSRVWDES